ncbi:hypothetical protein IQ235_09415 [Oscillatoriales cyanobacterium LEGE 11467]|uniref:Uncharacterized protein n=1 Tax=Zarconia navalis LEGE 11467 TaxID=1828826 RepID=A0A928VY92_9CYAN|nr:hypothetical protein [Zarconia navalis]MBE9040997.1 hypothetical protein [Zarconia navalis LEGE 11467]
MNEDRSPEALRESLETQYEDLQEALPLLDLKESLSENHREICEELSEIQIEFAAMRQIINHKLGISNHAS